MEIAALAREPLKMNIGKGSRGDGRGDVGGGKNELRVGENEMYFVFVV